MNSERGIDKKGRPLGIIEGLPKIVQNAESSVTLLAELPNWAKELESQHWLPEQIIIADPLSYCAGVERANRAADQMLRDSNGETVYFYHAPIHNESKVREWEAKGARIVNSLDEVPEGSLVLFSAHGIGPKLWLEAERKHLKVMDATCPLVDKTHREVKRFVQDGYKVLLIGKKDHDEIIGTVGYAPEDIVVIPPKINYEELVRVLEDLDDVDRLALGTQTTLAYSDLLDLIKDIRTLRPDIVLPKKDDVCYATQNRQEAVIAAIEKTNAEIVVVFGSDETKGDYKSNNSIELRETSRSHGAESHLVEDFSEIEPQWLAKYRRIGISAGASAAPERVVEFLGYLRMMGLKNKQINRITVVYEDQLFVDPVYVDFSSSKK